MVLALLVGGEVVVAGQLIFRCVRWMKVESILVNASVFIAAWKSGGYCLISRSVVSQSPYFGCLGLPFAFAGDEVPGGNTKPFSSPVQGSMSGGSQVSCVCATVKVSVFTKCATRSSAASFAGLEKILDLNVMLTPSKTAGAIRLLKSWHTRRSFTRSSRGTNDKIFVRQTSESQTRMNDGFDEKTRLHREWNDAAHTYQRLLMTRATSHIHCSPMLSISPNNNLDPARVEDVLEKEEEGLVTSVEAEELV